MEKDYALMEYCLKKRGFSFAKGEIPLGKEAADDIREGIMKRLLFVCSGTIEERMKQLLEKHDPLGSIVPAMAGKETLEKVKAELLAETKKNGFKVFFKISPLLEEVVEIIITTGCRFAEEVQRNIALHKKEIEKKFFGGKRITKIKRIASGDLDTHSDGRKACRIETNCGKFIYKPHSLHSDQVIADFLPLVVPEGLKVPQVIDCGSYGFAEFIIKRRSETEEEARAFFVNAGKVLAFCHAFGSTDMHIENLLTVGSDIYFIDNETIFNPAVHIVQPERFEMMADYPGHQNSLSKPCLLPMNMKGRELSFLLNTDENESLLPFIDGETKTVYDYEDVLLQSFADTYKDIRKRKAEFIAYWENLKDVNLRVVIKATQFYIQRQMRLISVEFLQDTKKREDYFDYLRNMQLDKGFNITKEVVEAEIENIRKWDVPLFYTYTNSRALYCEGKMVAPEWFAASCAESVTELLKAMSDADFTYNKKYIVQQLKKAKRKSCLLSDKDYSRLAGKELRKIWEELKEECMTEPLTGELFWLKGLEDNGLLLPTSSSYYSGYLGIALFLAAYLPYIRNKAQKAETAAILKKLREQTDWRLKRAEKLELLPEGYCFEGLSGIGGLIYACLNIGRLLKDDKWCRLARRGMKMAARLQLKEQRYDFVLGTSGLLYTLLVMRPGLEQEKGYKKLIRRLADHILAGQTTEGKGLTLWRQSFQEKKPRLLSGLGHGMAGIALALYAAYKYLDDEACKEAALAALNYEHNIFSARLGDWPDLRKQSHGKDSEHGLCNGAPGMLMVYAGLRELGCDFPHLEEDYQRALGAMKDIEGRYPDHVCYGKSAYVESFLTVCRCNGEEKLLARAKEAMKAVLVSGKRNEGYVFVKKGEQNHTENDLFFGIAGIGYELLRLRDNSLPNLLV